jgi:ATP-dependent Clp protease protease subunit
VEEIEKDAERDCWFSAEEAIGYGLVDEIVQNSK